MTLLFQPNWRKWGMTLLISLGWSIPLWAQGTGSGFQILGQVCMPDGRPAVRASVRLSNSSGLQMQALTDSQGHFQFYGLPRSVVNLTAASFEDAKVISEPVSVALSRIQGPIMQVNLYLHLPAETSGKKGKNSPLISVREASQKIPKEARKEYEAAIKHRDKQQLDQALRSLQNAVELYPEYFQAYNLAGEIHLDLGGVNEAALDYEKALKIFPDYEPSVRGSGLCLLLLQKFEMAAGFLEKASSLDSANPQTHLFLGMANLALGRWQKARQELELALRLNPVEAVSSHLYLAEVFAVQNQFDRAADELQTYLRSAPAAPNADQIRTREEQYRLQANSIKRYRTVPGGAGDRF